MSYAGGEKPVCDPQASSHCQVTLERTFDRLLVLEPPFPLPSTDEIVTQCHAEFLTLPVGANSTQLHLRIKGSYPNHPSQIRLPGQVPQSIDFSTAAGPIIMMAGVSSFGNGDDQKWLGNESMAGLAYVSLVPLPAGRLSDAADMCAAFSPVREVTSKFSRDGEWSEALATVGVLAETDWGSRGNASLPTAQEMRFPYQNENSRYWGAWKQGDTEVETFIVGGMPTHVPSEREGDPTATKQCELGAWYQRYEYDRRPMVSLDGSPQGFPRDTKFICVRALETEPTPLLQVAIDVGELQKRGSVLLQHDSLRPQEVKVLYGPTAAEIEWGVKRSLFTLYLGLQQPIDLVFWDVGGVLNDSAAFWKIRADLAAQYGVSETKLIEYSDKHRAEVDLGQLSEEEFWRGALRYAGVAEERLVEAAVAKTLSNYLAPIHGSVAIMDQLQGRVQQGVLSNDSMELGALKRRVIYPKVVEAEKIFVLSADVGAKKPDLKIYQEALRRAGMEETPNHVLLIDDSSANCQAAQESGMDCIIFENPEQLRAALEQRGLL